MNITGTDRTTGRAIAGIAHVRQSINDILTTPVGTRIAVREYGSRLFELIDSPQNESLRIELVAASAEAIIRWEPRVRIERITVTFNSDGRPVLDIEGDYLPEGEPVKIEGMVV